MNRRYFIGVLGVLVAAGLLGAGVLFDFRLRENCRHSCGLGWRARVSGRQILDFRLWTVPSITNAIDLDAGVAQG